MIEQYVALALQPIMRGCQKRSEIVNNIKHLYELIDAAVWLSGIDAPVRLIAIPEGALQGFTDEIFDWEHTKYVDEIAIDVPGEETGMLGRIAKQRGAYIIAQAKAKHPDIPERFFNCGFLIDPRGKIILKHYKLQVFGREHSTVPHDVWDKWVELYGENLDAFYQVADTEIGRIGLLICMEGCFPETARGLAMNGAEIIYRPSFAEPHVSDGMWEVQNRARALDNSCYVVAPNVASYYLTQESENSIDVFGGHSMIVDYQGRVIASHKYGAASSYAAAIIDVEALRHYRTNTIFGNFLKDLRTEQYRLIYDKAIFPKNLYLEQPPLHHAEYDELIRERIQDMVDRGIYKRPAADEGARVKVNQRHKVLAK